MSTWLDRFAGHVAMAIMTNGDGALARRVKLEGPDVTDLGGRCFASVKGQVVEVFERHCDGGQLECPDEPARHPNPYGFVADDEPIR